MLARSMPHGRGRPPCGNDRGGAQVRQGRRVGIVGQRAGRQGQPAGAARVTRGRGRGSGGSDSGRWQWQPNGGGSVGAGWQRWRLKVAAMALQWRCNGN